MKRSLAPCPASPNCVSSQASDPKKFLSPLGFGGPVEDVRESLDRVIREMPRARVVESDARYVHFEVTSRIFRFVDDVEFLIDVESRLVHFRSASRVGYSDLGANRRRMSALSRRLARENHIFFSTR